MLFFNIKFSSLKLEMERNLLAYYIFYLDFEGVSVLTCCEYQDAHIQKLPPYLFPIAPCCQAFMSGDW